MGKFGNVQILQPTFSQLVTLDPWALSHQGCQRRFLTRSQCQQGLIADSRIMRDIMEVPLPRACSKRLMSFFTFHISIFFSASLAWEALIVSEGDDYGHSGSRCCRGYSMMSRVFPSPCEEFGISSVYRRAPEWDFSSFYAFMPPGLAGLVQATFFFFLSFPLLSFGCIIKY